MSVYCQNVPAFQKDLTQVPANNAAESKREKDKVFLSPTSVCRCDRHFWLSLKIPFEKVIGCLRKSYLVKPGEKRKSSSCFLLHYLSLLNRGFHPPPRGCPLALSTGGRPPPPGPRGMAESSHVMLSGTERDQTLCSERSEPARRPPCARARTAFPLYGRGD